jgi:hypothetical protein
MMIPSYASTCGGSVGGSGLVALDGYASSCLPRGYGLFGTAIAVLDQPVDDAQREYDAGQRDDGRGEAARG